MIEDILKNKILVLDGAMGTMIQRFSLEEEDFRGERFKDHDCDLKGNNDLLSITRPDVISSIHEEYLNAGADIIETNTFSSTSVAQDDYNLSSAVYDLNYQSAQIAKKAAMKYSSKEKPRFVAGSIGPTNRTASISPDVENPAYRAITFDQLKETYKEQIIGLVEGGVDLLLVETVFDTLNCKAALFAIEEVFEEKNVKLPIMVSGTITDESGRTLSGQTAEAFLNSISHISLLSVGFNCALGTKAMTPYVKELSDKAPFFVSAYPNAGLPNEMGEYDESPKAMALQLEDFLKRNLVNIIGGCCGTTPDHIKAFSDLVKKYSPRERPSKTKEMRLSGLEAVTISSASNFTNIGERTNVTGSLKFKRLIKENNFEEALDVALNQVEGGAQAIDVNMDDGMLDGKESMVHFLTIIMKGRYLHEGDVLNKTKHIVIGRLVEEDLFQKENALGKYIHENGNSWRVVGVFQDEGGDREERNLYVPYTTEQRMTNNDEVDQMIVVYDKNMSYEQSLTLEKELDAYIKNLKIISPKDNRGIYISNTGEQQENSRQFASVLQIIISFIGIGTLVAGVIGISNIMVFVVKERTKEIGIRKAIGASPRSIIAMILQESIFITMISGYAGLVVAILILNSIGDSLMDKYFISSPYIETSNAIWATIILIFFGALAGYLPARKAAKIKPIIALRDK